MHCLPHAMFSFFMPFMEEQLSPKKEKKKSPSVHYFYFLFFSLLVAFSSDWRCAFTDDPPPPRFTLSCFRLGPSWLRCLRAGPSARRRVSSIFHHDVLFTALRTPAAAHSTRGDGGAKAVQYSEKLRSHGGHSRESYALCPVCPLFWEEEPKNRC